MKYLKYWWKANSVVDPNHVKGTYYRVAYHRLGQIKTVEEYDESRALVGITHYHWKWTRLAKTYSYGPNGDMLFSQVYRYGWLGNVRGVEKYSPDGKLIRVETKNL